MPKKALPSAAELRQLLRHDPETGKIYLRDPVEVCACVNSLGYKVGNVGGRHYLNHRLMWLLHYGRWPEGVIDHINGDRSDNRIDNLRDVTQAENCRNMKRNSARRSGVTGVHWDKAKQRWKPQIGKKWLGYFVCLGRAIEARKRAEQSLGYHPNHGRRA